MGTGGLRLFPPEISRMEIRGFACFGNRTTHTQMIALLEKESESRNESDF